MVYKSPITFDYNELTQETQYRFAEIEIQLAINALERIHRFDTLAINTAQQTIYNNTFMEHRRTPERESAFFEAVHTNYFRSIRKDELAHYLKWKNAGYSKIVKFAKRSPNTVSKMRFEAPPLYFPIYPHWDEQLLAQWNLYKKNFNLFEEELTHW